MHRIKTLQKYTYKTRSRQQNYNQPLKQPHSKPTMLQQPLSPHQQQHQHQQQHTLQHTLQPIKVATQNVGGMRREFQQKKGPKLATIRSLITPHTDFLILTETKADHRAIRRTKLRFNMRVSHFSANEGARGGVIICAKDGHKKMEGSERESVRQGYIAGAVYEIKKSRTIVIGVYGLPDNDDRASSGIMREVSRMATELQGVYNTQHLIIAGDFNTVLELEDTTAEQIQKRNTSASLHDLIDRHRLVDLGHKGHKTEHTWHRSDDRTQSSRLDMIFTNVPISTVKIHTTNTIFDHTFLQADISQMRTDHVPTMKDHILGSEEYLITAIDLMQEFVNTYSTAQVQEAPEEQQPGTANNGPLDHHCTFAGNNNGITTLHIFNSMVQKLHTKYKEVAKQQNQSRNDKIRNLSTEIQHLLREKKRTHLQQRREEVTERIKELQREFKLDIEAKDKATQTRISNFHRSGIGKMTPETFYCVKEKHASKDIHELEHEGRTITDPEEIVRTMQQWYEDTAQAVTPQTMNLQEFLQENDISLPQIDEDHKEMLQEEFTQEEVKEAIQEAHEASASGPSGQSIVFYKLIFMMVPELMTTALNQLIFTPRLGEDTAFQWIKNRKIIYIPKKTQPKTPSDYRPLSLLEVLYKIPSRILNKRLTQILPQIIGPHQHGFMAQKGIQEPSILVTHMIQDANRENKPLQIVSFDIEKAFDRVSHICIKQALRAFGVPEIMVEALAALCLTGHAQVEVNGKKGILISVRTGSGQGDPPSSTLFLIATEPLNRALAKNHLAIMYTTAAGTTVGPVFYADDSAAALALRRAADLQPIIDTYGQYTRVSGLNINLGKTTALCINTSEEIIRDLQNMGINTPETTKHLGIYLGVSIEATMEATMANIQPKRIQRRIRATTPPTDLLHRAILINSALIPLYNHIFMALPLAGGQADTLHKEILNFLWTRQKDGVTRNKRKLVAKNRLPASHDKGGLQIPHPRETCEGLHINLLQKIYRKSKYPHKGPHSHLPRILEDVLQLARRPTLQFHVETYGPDQWTHTAERMRQYNLLFAELFHSMAKLLRLHEGERGTWHVAALNGHSLFNKLLPLTRDEASHLLEINTRTVGQIYDTDETGQLQNRINPALLRHFQGERQFQEKMNLFIQAMNKKRLPFRDKHQGELVSGGLLLRKETKMSQEYRKMQRKKLDAEIKTAPAYASRIRDGIYYPTPETFTNAYKVMQNKHLPSKTKETAFQILNRTIWTNNKAHKSGRIESSQCDKCAETETTEHLLCECAAYSAPLWQEMNQVLTQSIIEFTGERLPTINLTQREIIFNALHPSIELHVKGPSLRGTIEHVIQETKRDIIYRRMNQNQREINTTRIRAHLLSIIRRIISLYKYQGTRNLKDNIQLLQTMDQIICDRT